MTLKLEGAFTALVTPLRDDQIDHDALARLVEFQIADGIAGVVPVGTTGESPTLTAAEAREVIATTVRVARGRVPVIAGTGTNATAETIARTRAAQELGADAAMIVMPYYNRPTQRGLVAHVRAVHDASALPLVLYNVPARGTADLAADTVAEIARACPRVIALKEATGNVLRAREGAVAGVCRAMLQGDLAEARRRQEALLPLYDAMFLETNPGPVKAALALLGRIAPELRLPLAWPAEATVARIAAALREQGVSA